MPEKYTPSLRYAPHFHLTNYCNAFCAHCLVDASPCEKKNFIQYEHIIYQLDQFDQDPNFAKAVGFNGGEALMEYKFNPQSYFHKLLQECVRRNYSMYIKTNALWAKDGSIKDVIWDSFDSIDYTGYTKKIDIGLSVDMFHHNEHANQEIIARICNSDLSKHFELSAYVIPDRDDTEESRFVYERFYNLLSNDFLKENKLTPNALELKDVPKQYNWGLKLNDVNFMVEAHPLGNWGRAAKMGLGGGGGLEREIKSNFNIISYKKAAPVVSAETPLASNCNKSGDDLIAHGLDICYTSDGMADLIVPVDKMSPGVPYLENGEPVPWDVLYPRLVDNVEKRFNVIQGMHPDVTPEFVNLPNIMKALRGNSK